MTRSLAAKKKCAAKRQTLKLMRGKKGLVSPAPSNKAVSLLKLLASKVTGAGGVEAYTLRTILFGVDENAAKIVYDSYQDRIERHRLERLQQSLASDVKHHGAEKDPKAREALSKRIEKDAMEFGEIYRKELRFMSEIWDRHATFMNDLIMIEREIHQDIETLRTGGFSEELLQKIRADAVKLALQMKEGGSKELALAQALKTSTFSVAKYDPRDSDTLDRIDRRLGYRIDSLNKRIEKTKTKIKEASDKADRQSMFSAVEEAIAIFFKEWLEVHAVGMNVGVLMARLTEHRPAFEKIMAAYAQADPAKRGWAEQIVNSLRKEEADALGFFRDKAQQVQMREQTLIV